MKKLFSILVIVFVIAVFFAQPGFAMEGEPAGSCPPVFTLHHFMDHDGEHMHQHIGLTEDLNGDGFICMKVVANDFHLHVDNYLPLP